MTPQQQSAEAIIAAIRRHPHGLPIDELLSEVLKATELRNVFFYLGSGRNFASFLHDLERRNLLELSRRNDKIFVHPTSELVGEAVLSKTG
jgi:hypothetical protein